MKLFVLLLGALLSPGVPAAEPDCGRTLGALAAELENPNAVAASELRGADAAAVNRGKVLEGIEYDPQTKMSGTVWTGRAKIAGEAQPVRVHVKSMKFEGENGLREVADTNRAHAAAQELKLQNLEVPQAFSIRRDTAPPKYWVVSTDVGPAGGKIHPITDITVAGKGIPNPEQFKEGYRQFLRDLDTLYAKKGIAHGDVTQNLFYWEEGGRTRFGLIDWDGRASWRGDYVGPDDFIERYLRTASQERPNVPKATLQQEAEAELAKGLRARDKEHVDYLNETILGPGAPKLSL